jgi:uncharacterized protein
MAEAPKCWRLREQLLTLKGEVCPYCETKLFPPRAVCPACQNKGELEVALFKNETIIQLDSSIMHSLG